MHVPCVTISADLFASYFGHADVHCLFLDVEAVASDSVNDLSPQQNKFDMCKSKAQRVDAL